MRAGGAPRGDEKATGRLRSRPALLAAMVVAIVLAGCGSSGPSASSRTPSPPAGTGASAPAADGHCASRGQAPAQPTTAVPGTTWPERRVGLTGPMLTYSGLAVDPVTGTAYALIPRAGSAGHGPYRLTCIALPAGTVRKGPELRTPDLALASGYLWASGEPGRTPVIIQLDPRNLRVIRSIRLPGIAAPGYAPIHVTTGPGQTVWAGSARSGRQAMLYRLDIRSGRILTTARLPNGTVAYDLAADPSLAVLYASAAGIIRGGPASNQVLEFDARSGRLLATADHGLVTDSVAGSSVTAAPGGVWDSFRTGMLGLTLHLRQADLALTAPTGPGIVQSAPQSLFHWAMYASTVYGGGSLWLTNQSGMLACLDPGSGRTRAIERLSQRKLVYQLFAADPARHLLYGADNQGLVVITPPAACWTS